jgi:hypothetical protein
MTDWPNVRPDFSLDTRPCATARRFWTCRKTNIGMATKGRMMANAPNAQRQLDS